MTGWERPGIGGLSQGCLSGELSPRKLVQYRATLDAGADPATVARWISGTEAERARHQATKRTIPQLARPKSMSRDEIVSVVTALSDLLIELRHADPADKASA